MLAYLIYMKTVTSATLKDWEYNANLADPPSYVLDETHFYYKAYYKHLYEDVYSTFERYYAWLVVFDLPTALNSALNPIIYYWRMKPFRVFVHQGMRDVSSSTGHSHAETGGNVQSKAHRLSIAHLPTLNFGVVEKNHVAAKTESSTVCTRATDYQDEVLSGEKASKKIRFKEAVLENNGVGENSSSGITPSVNINEE